jgi:hypothetical protein
MISELPRVFLTREHTMTNLVHSHQLQPFAVAGVTKLGRVCRSISQSHRNSPEKPQIQMIQMEQAGLPVVWKGAKAVKQTFDITGRQQIN